MTETVHSPLGAPTATVATTMRRVLLALSPGIVIYTAFFGWGLLIQLMLASVTALALEAIMLKIRKRPVIPHLTDYSALVTAWLLAICLPPLLPWWMTVLAGIQPIQPGHGWLRRVTGFISPGNDPVAAAGKRLPATRFRR